MRNKYSKKQLEELYHCEIFKTAACDGNGYLFWFARGLPFTEDSEDRLFSDACGWDLNELHEDIRASILEESIVLDS